MKSSARGAVRRRIVGGIALLALLIASIAAWWVVPQRAPSRAAIRDRSARVDPHDVGVATNPETSDAAHAAARVERVEDSTLGGSTASSDLSVEPTPLEGVAIVVVDGESGAPQPGALVTRIDPYWNPAPRDDVEPDLDRMLDAMGRRFRADESGRLRVPPSRGALELFARNVDRIGSARLEASEMRRHGDPNPLRIEVAPRRTLLLQTIDARGAPVSGIPIDTRSGMVASVLLAGSFVSRAPDGVVALRPADLFFDEAAWPTGIVFAVAFAHLEPTVVRVTKVQIGGPPVQIVVPDHGFVDVEIVDPAGAPLETAGRRSLALRRHASDPAQFESNWDDHDAGSVDAEFVHGRARVGPIELGLQLVADEYFDDAGHVAGEAPGPARAGETTRMRLVAGEKPLVYTGTVVDAHGAPLGGVELRGRFHLAVDGSSMSGPIRCTTAPDGAFRLAMGSAKRDYYRTGDFRFSIGHAAGGLAANGSVELTTELALQGGSLGTIALEPCGRVVSGIVVDDEGAPIEHAVVSLLLTESWCRAVRREQGLWLVPELEGMETRSDAAGRFELFGASGPGDFELFARSSLFVASAAVPVEPGATDVRLVLTRAASLFAHVLLDPGISPNVVAARLLFDFAEGDSRNARADLTSPDARGDLVWRHLLPRRATVTGFATDCLSRPREPLFRFGDVELAPGEETRDPRLQAIDLRGRFQRTRLEIVDRDGAPVPRGEVREIPEPGGSAMSLAFTRGESELHTAGTWPPIDVTAPGFRSARTTPASPSLRVVLRPGVSARLVVEGAAPRVPAPLSLTFAITPIGGSGDPRGESFTGQFTGEPIEARLCDPGRYSVRWSLVLPNGSYVSRAIEIEGASSTVELADVDELQEIRCSIDPVALAVTTAKLFGQ